MSFNEIARNRQSCRSYNPERNVEGEKIFAVLESARLSPSACNGQPYHITVCKGEAAKKIASCVQGMGMNRFASDVPVFLVISEKPYVKTAAVGSKLKHNDYRSIDIGILSAYITAEAASQGLGSCILGWFDSDKIESLCSLDGTVRLVITLGYPKDGEVLREKKRKTIDELVSFVD